MNSEILDTRLDEARRLALRSADQQGLYRVLMSAAYSAFVRQEAERVQTLIEELPQSPEEIEDRGLRAAMLFLRAQNELVYGSVERGLAFYVRCIETAKGDAELGRETLGGLSPLCTSLAGRSYCSFLLGRLSHGAEEFETVQKVVQRSERDVDRRNYGTVLIYANLITGSRESVLLDSREALAAAEESGNRVAIATAGMIAAWGPHFDGDPGGRIETLEKAIDVFDAGAKAWSFYARLGLARALREQDERERAGRILDSLLDDPSTRGNHALFALIERGHLLAGDTEGRAEQELGACLERIRVLFEHGGAQGFRPQIEELEAHHLRLQGDVEGSRTRLQEALASYEKMGASGHADRVRLEIAP